MTKPTAEEVRALLDYDPETGVFTWKVTRGKARAGALAGFIDKEGRTRICIGGARAFAYRLAWLFVTGAWPLGEIDHLDGNCANNRFSNLRDVSRLVNQQNVRKARSDNAAGVLGVYRNSTGKPWSTSLRVGGKGVYLGRFATAEAAHAAYLDAKRRLHAGCTI